METESKGPPADVTLPIETATGEEACSPPPSPQHPASRWASLVGMTPTGTRNSNRLGATIIPVRTGVNGELEVLLTQQNVVNFLKSEAGKPRTVMNFPGEFRFLGAFYKPEVDVTPLDTALRGLTSAGSLHSQRYIRSYDASRELLSRAALQASLFEVTGPNRQITGPHKTFHFVCKMTAEVSAKFVNQLNQLLEEQLKNCTAKGESLFQINEALRAPLCPMFRRVAWWPISEVFRRYNSEFIDEYQREEFAKHGLKARVQGNSHMSVLERLRHLTVEMAFEKAVRFERQLQIDAKNAAAEETDDEEEMKSAAEGSFWASPSSPTGRMLDCPELETVGFSQLKVLSFNLNILPFGAVSWTAVTGSDHAFVRLKHFLDILREDRAQAEAAAASPPNGALDWHCAELPVVEVVAVQELFASPFVPGCCAQTYAIGEMAKMGYSAVTGGRTSLGDLVFRKKWTDSGLVIFSRLPVVHSQTLRFSAGAAMDAGACKGAIWARLQLAEGRYLDVFNCHLQASHTGPHSELFERIRRTQLMELREFIKLAGSEHPFVLTGDFNVDAIPEPPDPMGTYGFPFRPPRRESEEYQRMIELLDTNGRLVDLLAVNTEDDPLGGATPATRRHPCTRPPRLRLPGSAHYAAKHKFPQRLDYVFYRPTLTSLVEHDHTHIEEFAVRGCGDFDHLSDHYGIRVHLRLRCSMAWASSSSSVSPASTTGLTPTLGHPRHGKSGRAAASSFCLASTPARGLLGMGLSWSLATASFFLWWRSWRRQGSFPAWKDKPLSSLLCRVSWLSWFSPLTVGLLCGGCALSARRKLMTLAAEEEEPSTPLPRQPYGPAHRTVASSPYDTFAAAVDAYGGRRCIGSRVFHPDGTLGEFSWMTYRDAQREILRISSGLLRKFDLKRNARVGLLGDASPEWLLCDIALMRCGVDIVCLADSSTDLEASADSLRDLELLICSGDWLEHCLDARGPGGSLTCPIVTLQPALPRLAAVAKHRGLEVCELEFIAHVGEAEGWLPYFGIGGWEVFTTMYRSRSGSKSLLAGVSVSLQQLTMAAHSVAENLGLGQDDVHFSHSWPAFAPERLVLHAMLASGGAVGFFSGVRSPRVFEDVKKLRPTFLMGTPCLFHRQITRLLHKQVGRVGRSCVGTHRWALQVVEKEEKEEAKHRGQDIGRYRRWRLWLAQMVLTPSILSWLEQPFLPIRSVLIGRRTHLRFILALCTSGNTALNPRRCHYMRFIFGCPVLKSCVTVEGGGFVSLGEAPYFDRSTLESFNVGRALPGVEIELLPLEVLPQVHELGKPLSVLGSLEAGIKLGTMQVRGLTNSKMSRVGIVCGQRGNDLYLFGRLVSLEASLDSGAALCEALEQLLVQSVGPWLMQLLLTARTNLGVVGIAAVRTDELWRLVRRHRLEIRGPDAEDILADRRVRRLCLECLQDSARQMGFSEAEIPRALHLQPTLFSLEAGLQTPTFALRRDQLLPRFSGTIEGLFRELQTHAQKTFERQRQRSLSRESHSAQSLGRTDAGGGSSRHGDDSEHGDATAEGQELPDRVGSLRVVTRGRGSSSPPSGGVLTRAARALLPVASWNSDTSQGEKFILSSETSGYPETSPCSDMQGGLAIEEDGEVGFPAAGGEGAYVSAGVSASSRNGRPDPQTLVMPPAASDIYRTGSNSSTGSKLWLGRCGSEEFGFI